MPKNVSITLDGKTKIMSGVTKIQTCLEDGGNCLWIPKDDVPLTTLTVTEDGTYYPPENYYGFSKVIADGVGTTQMGELIEKTVDKNGTYNIGDESGSPYGYSKFTVNVDLSEDSGGGGGESKSPVVGKDEDGNDEMVDTDDDGNIVMTALPTDIKVIIPPTKLEYNRYESIDYSGISVYAYISKAIHWLGTTVTAISEGSTNNTVVVDGESVSVSIGDGVTYSPAPAVTYRLVWDGTKWIKSENYSAEKTVWKSEEYPTGKIPFEELIFTNKRINDYSELNNPYMSYVDPLSGKVVNIFKDAITVEDSFPILIWLYSGHEEYIGDLTIRLRLISTRDETYFIPYYTWNSITRTRALLVISDESFMLNLSASAHVNLVKKSLENRTITHYDAGVTSYLGDIGGGIQHGELYINEHDYPAYNVSSGTIIDSVYVYYGEIVSESTIYMHDDGRRMMPFFRYTYESNNPFNSTNTEVWVPDRYLTIFSSASSINSLYNDTTPFSLPVYINDIIRRLYKGQEELQKKFPVTLPVQWKRPGDGKILETTFTAWMKDEESNDGGQQPQPAPTPAPG